MEIEVTVSLLKGPQKRITYERKAWTMKYMYPSNLAQNFIDTLDEIVKKIRSKKIDKLQNPR